MNAHDYEIYLGGLRQALIANPLDGKRASDYLLSEINAGSTDRPHRFLDLHKHVFHNNQTNAGKAFWIWLARCWSGFDLIPHRKYATAFKRWRGEWSSDCMIGADLDAFNSLPETMRLYRGQDTSSEFGLSWTLDKSAAEGFARGHRGIINPHPVVLESTFSKSDIAIVITDRLEAEVVLFSLPARRVIQGG